MENGKCFEGERKRVRDRQTDRERGREEEGDRQIDNRSNIQYASNEVDPDSKE